ncbi:natural killer cell receptor 2B4-like [Danio aesculapii]|uniref:natural killer cell receptor 2B4-like n=1 Tax=Danio aesculapii TaxID=1142201 RepID=UPI0024BFE736|nr:natural killer cell receptor 2B4-like [Danio aesculapii]
MLEICVLLKNMLNIFACFSLCFWHIVGVSGVETDQMKSAEVTEGDSVTLHTGITQIQGDAVILWTFGPKDTYIAKINKAHNEIFHESVDGRFRDRLLLDNQTGSLTITNTSTEHSGSYQVEIVTGNKVSLQTFSLTVYASLSVPVISSFSPSSSSSSETSLKSSCVLLCSVVNVTQVTLSWYRGSRLLSTISISELNTTLSLHLELEDQDNNIYSCRVNNAISERTKHLNVSDFCQPEKPACRHDAHSFTEAVFQLVLSALVGVATVAVLLYEVCSRTT